MTEAKFISLIGQDIVVDYDFNGELQHWNMKNFTYNPETGTINHKWIPLLVDAMIPHFTNPHKGEATHG